MNDSYRVGFIIHHLRTYTVRIQSVTSTLRIVLNEHYSIYCAPPSTVGKLIAVKVKVGPTSLVYHPAIMNSNYSIAIEEPLKKMPEQRDIKVND